MQTHCYTSTREVPAYCWPARYAHVSLCAVRIGGMSAAASGVSRQGRLGAAPMQWKRQRRGGSGGSAGALAGALAGAATSWLSSSPQEPL